MTQGEQLEVRNLLKHIFDPRGTVFNGRPFLGRWARNGGLLSSGEILVFTSYASGAADEERFTKLILRFRADNDRALVIQCLTYETLAPQADVRVT